MPTDNGNGVSATLEVPGFESDCLQHLAVKLDLLFHFDVHKSQALPQPTVPEDGSKIIGFEILSRLGIGGMGNVYQARPLYRMSDVSSRTPGSKPELILLLEELPLHSTLPDVVAIKTIHPHLLEAEAEEDGEEVGPEEALARFEDEARLGTRVRSENVVRTFAIGRGLSKGRAHPLLVMEYVEGRTLRTLVESKERVPEELLRSIARQLAHGLAAIHRCTAIHRDMKPENLIITEGKEPAVKIMDLGIAHLADRAARLTQPDLFMGSLAYAAPEQFDGGSPDHRVDFFALGIVLYELATGTHPFEGKAAITTLRGRKRAPPIGIRERNARISPFLERIIQTLLERDPNHRFHSADELATILEVGEDSTWWQARPRRRTAKDTARWLAVRTDARFVGRQEELAALRAMYQEAADGTAQTVLLEGQPGIGKSRLITEFLERLQDEERGPLILVSGAKRGRRSGGHAALAAALRRAVPSQNGSFEELGRHLHRVPRLRDDFLAFISECAPGNLTADQVTRGFEEVLRGLAEERNLVLVVDHLDDCPPDTASVFCELSETLQDAKVMLIGIFRADLPKPVAQLSEDRLARKLMLHPLAREETAALVDDYLGTAGIAEALADPLQVTGGNPQFALEIVQAAKDQKILRKRESAWAVVGAADALQVPPGIREAIHARLARLGKGAVQLLRIAACMGERFDPHVVRGCSSIPEDEALDLFDRIHEGAPLITWLEGGAYAFDPEIARDVLLEGVSPASRQVHHRRIAQQLMIRRDQLARVGATHPRHSLSAEICRHFLDSDQPFRAWDHAADALTDLQREFRSIELVDLADRLLAMRRACAAPAATDELDLMILRGRCLGNLGETAEMIAQYRRALWRARELAPPANAEYRLRICTWVGWHHATRQLGTRAERWIRRAEATLGNDLGQALSARLVRRAKANLAGMRGSVHYWQGEFEAANEAYQRQYEIALELQSDIEEELEQATDPAAKRVVSLELNSALTERMRAEGGRANTAWALGRASEAFSQRAAQRATASRLGNVRHCILADINDAQVLTFLGAFDEARKRLQVARTESAGYGLRRLEAVCAGAEGCLAMAEERYDEARRHLDDARHAHDALDEDRRYATICLQRAMTWATERTPEDWQHGLRTEIELADSHVGARPWTFPRVMMTTLGVHLDEARASQAREQLAAAEKRLAAEERATAFTTLWEATGQAEDRDRALESLRMIERGVAAPQRKSGTPDYAASLWRVPQHRRLHLNEARLAGKPTHLFDDEDTGGAGVRV
jgi:serine/threonine protein kinase